MGRLIDFDVCEKILTEFYESSLNDHDAMLFVEFMAQLENVPTAYDVAKVAEQIRCDCYTMGFDESQTEIIINDVRKGGVE